MKIKTLPIAAITLCWAIIPDALADMSIDMVRVTCIPELQYHTREKKEYTLLAEAIAHGFEGHDEAARKKRLTLLEGHGLYLLESKNQGCPTPLHEMAATAAVVSNNQGEVDVMRITCIPELRYFEIETLKDAGLKSAMSRKGGNGVHSGGVRNQLDKYGLFLPKDLKYTCKLPETTYELTVAQTSFPESRKCGAGLRTSFSLSANGRAWFRDIHLDEGCLDTPSIASMIISDGKEGWTGRREMITCLKEKPGTPVRCPFRGLPLAAHMTIPASTKGIERDFLEKRLIKIEADLGFPVTQENLIKSAGK